MKIRSPKIKTIDEERMAKLREFAFKAADDYEWVKEKERTKHDWYRFTLNIREKITNKNFIITISEGFPVHNERYTNG